eukprot:2120233-Rhodomonas_salina.1
MTDCWGGPGPLTSEARASHFRASTKSAGAPSPCRSICPNLEPHFPMSDPDTASEKRGARRTTRPELALLML